MGQTSDLLRVDHTTHTRALDQELKYKLGVGIQRVSYLDEALERMNELEYPLILINDPVAAGNARLPEGLDLSDWLETSTYFIEEARKIRESTPIVMTHVGTFSGYSMEEALRRLEDSGLSGSFNIFSPGSYNQFPGFIRSHLPNQTTFS